MEDSEKLNVGDKSIDLKTEIVDEDRLCYLVKSENNGAYGIRTISKRLVQEFVNYFRNNPERNASEARSALSGKTDIDKYE